MLFTASSTTVDDNCSLHFLPVGGMCLPPHLEHLFSFTLGMVARQADVANLISPIKQKKIVPQWASTYSHLTKFKIYLYTIKT